MWKRATSLLLRHQRSALAPRSPAVSAAAAPSLCRTPEPLFFSTLDAAGMRTRVEDVMPIATGLEREEIEAELQGKKRFDMDAPVGPFGTKEAPAVIQSYYNKRIVGCPGGEGEDEHDVVWFWLEKGKLHECPVCTQYFMLDVIGGGGSPDGHDDDDDHHH
ncbi:putative cytochrome c oxidase subunit 5b-like [Panicum miliaceum]|uniref:Cytochrome c oxidase subunit 5b-like n=1 Tax=Panicum miliaceum TaxID=4540 RepID=A0A3L6PEG8_PANMI|nr:putative cytochrome c oxidase subunit 5b-like [Panicum miliaceum]